MHGHSISLASLNETFSLSVDVMLLVEEHDGATALAALDDAAVVASLVASEGL